MRYYIYCAKQICCGVVFLVRWGPLGMTGRRFHRTMEMISAPPPPGSLKALLFPPLLNKVENKGTQGVRARYDTELPPIISIVRHPGRPVILGTDPNRRECKLLN